MLQHRLAGGERVNLFCDCRSRRLGKYVKNVYQVSGTLSINCLVFLSYRDAIEGLQT